MNEKKTEQWEYIIFQLDVIRKAKGMTHKQLGEKLNISQSNITKFFSGKTNPTLETINKVTKGLDFSIELKDNTGELDMDKVKEAALNKIDILIIQKRNDIIDDILK